MADGSVKIEVGLNIGKAEKDLAKLKEKINKAENELNSNSARKTELEKQIAQVGAQADEAKKKVIELKDQLNNTRSREEKASIRAQLAEATEEQRILTRESDRLNDEYVKVSSNLEKGKASITEMKEQAGEMARQIEASRPGEAIAKSLDNAKKSLTRFLKYAIGIRSVYILFQRLKGAIKSAVQEYAEYDKELKYNLALMSATRKAIQVTNGAALASAFNAILPIVQKIANWTLEAANNAAKFIAILSGKSSYKRAVVNTAEVAASLEEAEEDTEDTAEAADDVADGFKEVKKQVLGFDELNILDTETDTDTEKNGKDAKEKIKEAEKAALDGIDVIEEKIDEYDTSNIARIARFIRDHLDEIKTAALGIGAAIGTWKLGKLLERITGLSVATKDLLGAAIGIGGSIVYIRGFFDAWENGLDNGNLTEMILGATAAITGFGLAFGAVGAGIASLVTGLGFAAIGFKEWAETGEMTEKILAAINAGIGLIGISLSLLTGSWIPLAIAAIGMLLFNLPEVLSGLSDFFYSLGFENLGEWFKGMSEKAEDARDWLRINVVEPVCKYITDAFNEWNTGEHRGEYKDSASWFICGVLGLPTDDEWKQWGINAVNWLGEGFFDLAEVLHEVIGGPLEKLIEEDIPETLEWFKDMGKIVLGHIGEGFVGITDWLHEHIGKPIQDFVEGIIPDRFRTMREKVTFEGEESGKETTDSYAEGIKNGQDPGSALESTIGNTVLTFFSGLFNRGKDGGKNTADGFAKGIEENSAASEEEAKKMGTAAVEALSEALDAHSPSKKTEEQGKNAVDGFKNAIESGTPTVIQAAHSMMEQLIREYSDGIEQLKQVMDFTWSLPRPSIPTIGYNIKTVNYGDGQSVSIPEFFVDWYAKGGVFDYPQLIGVGEAGKEAVVPLEKNTEWINIVADGLMNRLTQSKFVNDLAAAFASTPRPAMAGGGIVPPNAVGGAGISQESMQQAIERGVYNAIMALGGMPKSRGSMTLDVNGREFARAIYSDFQAVGNEHGMSLIES